MAFNDSISQLTGNSTFYDWFIKENDEIISKLNLAQVSSVTGGDGILASLNATSGLVTLSIGGTSGTITTGLTFAGDIIFSGNVNLPNLSYRISGITTGTSGFTFGTVVRITTDGYTFAIANDPDAAEVVGVLSAIENSYSIVTISGKIDGDFSDVAGGTLSPGCVYFLDPSNHGQITVTEPSTLGQVSKPVILGLSETSGVIVPYRGNYLNSSVAGGGESGANRVYVAISNNPTNPSDHGFSAGNFISYAPGILAGNTFFNQVLTNSGRTAIDGWFLSGSKFYAYDITTDDTIYTDQDYAPEENFIVGMIETVTPNTPTATENLYQIIIKGTSTIIPESISQYTGEKRGSWNLNGFTYEVNASGITQQMVPQPLYSSIDRVSYQLGFVFDSSPTYWYVNPKPTEQPLISNSLRSTSSATSFSSGLLNNAFNGDFSVWQRNTGKSQYTTSGDIYFADNWIRRQSGIAAGSAQYIQRQSFAVTSTDVEGNPEYYIDLKCVADPGGADPAGGVYSVGHVIEDIETFNGSSITVSFYAKCSLPSYTANVYFARYSGGSQVSKTTIGTISLQTSWNKHVINYDVDSLPASSYTDDYVEIGVDLIPLVETAFDSSVATGTGLYVSLASMCVYVGTYANPPHQFEKYPDKLRKAQRFYFSTYKENQLIGSKTMLSSTNPSLNTFGFSQLPTAPFGIFQLPTRMRSEPTVALYSPLTGVVNEVYNYTAGRDLKNTSGTIGYASQNRVSKLGTPTVNTSSDETSVRINISSGSVPYDVLNCHIVADASYPI
jgi:hypothetical protein